MAIYMYMYILELMSNRLYHSLMLFLFQMCSVMLYAIVMSAEP